MTFYKLPSNARKLLKELNEAEDPVTLIDKKFEGASNKEDTELRGVIKELSDAGYITVQWADNIPWTVTINNYGRTYEKQLSDYEKDLSTLQQLSIIVGNNNTFNNSPVGSTVNNSNTDEKENFFQKHPVISAIIATVIAGVILMFSFWQNIVTFIEGLF